MGFGIRPELRSLAPDGVGRWTLPQGDVPWGNMARVGLAAWEDTPEELGTDETS